MATICLKNSARSINRFIKVKGRMNQFRFRMNDLTEMIIWINDLLYVFLRPYWMGARRDRQKTL